MKKYLLIILFLIFKVVLNAQSDGYFSCHIEHRVRDDNEWSKLLLLPKTHGLDYNYPADRVPIENGALLMAGISVIYACVKRNRE